MHIVEEHPLVEPDADPQVVAEQRAENYAVVLLGSHDWNLRARSAAQARLDQLHRARLNAWRAEGKNAPEPTAPGNQDLMVELGEDLAIDAFFLALGFARGVNALRDRFRVLGGKTPP